MLGTIVNALAILIGGSAGMLIKTGLGQKYKDILIQAIGLSVFFIGASNAIDKLLLPEAHPLLFIISMVSGAAMGEFFNIEGKLKNLGDYFEKKLNGEGSFSKGFVSASLLFCVGSMAILGSFESGTKNEHSILFAKSVLDGVTSVIFASTWGAGVLLSALSVFIYQGALTLAAQIAEPYLTSDMLREISIVGGILIASIGIDMLGIRKLNIGNLLPSVAIPVLYYLVLAIF